MNLPHKQRKFILIASILLFLLTHQLDGAIIATRDIGPLTQIPRTKVIRYNGPIKPPVRGTASKQFFRSFRRGQTFSVYLSLPAGIYDIKLGFIQISDCKASANVFNVQFNGAVKLQSFDIFTAASACNRAVVEDFSWQRISVSGLTIRFTSVTGYASIAFVQVSKPTFPCKKATMKNPPSHLAHAVPGRYGPYTDWLGRGYHRVNLNGYQSHTHFSYGHRHSRIISYTWTLYPSGRVISKRPSFSYNFPIGSTVISLAVVDDACDRHEAITEVKVTTTVQPGMYCYFYAPMSTLPAPATLMNFPRPVYSSVSRTAAIFFPSKTQFRYVTKNFVMRCIFFIKLSSTKRSERLIIQTGGTGTARLYRGKGLVTAIPTRKMKFASSIPLTFSKGLSAFEVLYKRLDPLRKPQLSILIGNARPTVLFDQNAVLPILKAVTPSRGALSGGSVVMLTGHGFYWPMKVFFGTKGVLPERLGSRSTSVFVKTPKFSHQKVVSLFIQGKRGIRSNSLPFNITKRCEDVAFDKHIMRIPARRSTVPKLYRATSIAMGNDGRLYVGNKEGRLFALKVRYTDSTVTSMCASQILYDTRFRKSNGKLSPRSILGVTLDPRDVIPRPYVSVSTILWPYEISKNNALRWANGVVLRLKRTKNFSADPICLVRDKTIVQNLPTGPRDHAINELLFNQRGDLLISVGAHTNAGLPSLETGGMWETYFSGAVVIARLSRGYKFNGDIPYNKPYNPRLARPLKGYTDVELYATGLRNLFSMSMTRDGSIIGVDMGPNCGHGDVSSSCNEYSEDRAAKRVGKEYVRGRVQLDIGMTRSKKCPRGPSRKDKLLRIEQGKFYGHPNLQRGVLTGRHGECRWIDPYTNRPAGSRHTAPKNYRRPAALFYSAKTGVREYGSNLFCGELRGDLFLSQYSESSTWRARLKHGKVEGEPYEFLKGFSGIRLEENIHGDIIFPRYKLPGFFVARARVKQSPGLFAINALPFRHGSKGGTSLYIGGMGFSKSVVIFVGALRCKLLSATRREIRCRVPPRRWQRKSVDLKVVLGKQKAVLKSAILYMDK